MKTNSNSVGWNEEGGERMTDLRGEEGVSFGPNEENRNHSKYCQVE